MRRKALFFFSMIVAGYAIPPAAAQPQIPATADDVVVLARDRLLVSYGVLHASGQLAVNDKGGLALVGRGFKTAEELRPQFLADTVRLRSALIGGGPKFFYLFANTLLDSRNTTKILEGGEGPIPIPAEEFPLFPFPEAASVEPGSRDITVGTAAIDEIESGAYRDIRLRQFSILYIRGGTYSIRSLIVGRDATVQFSGPTTLNIAERLRLGREAHLLPQVEMSGRCVVINVASDRLIRFGMASDVSAILNAPKASLTLGRLGAYTGNFVAARAKIGRTAILRAESPLPAPCL